MYYLDRFGVDLEALLGQRVKLRRVNKELRARCPVHQGQSDTSLAVYDSKTGSARWKCHGCDKGGSSVDWLLFVDGCTLAEAFERLKIERTAPAPEREPEAPEPIEEPSSAWQTHALALLDEAQRCLWSDAGKPARGYLEQRGIALTTAKRCQLGYVPADRWCERWDGSPGKMYIPRGITVPYRLDGSLWRIVIRRNNADSQKERYTKYHYLGSDAPYAPAGSLAPALPILLCEGTLDALAIAQVSERILPVAIGATGCRRLHWMLRFARSGVILSFDNDPAGVKACQHWSDALAAYEPLIWQPVGAKDPAAMLELGAELIEQWLDAALERCTGNVAECSKIPSKRGAI